MVVQKNTSVSFSIPSIDGVSSLNPQVLQVEERQKIDRILNAPSSIGGWALLGKVALGVGVGALMSVILFIVMGAFGLVVGGGTNTTGGIAAAQGTHPLAWLILLFLGFLVTFLGNLLLITLYGVFFSHKYVKISKTIGILLLTNSILFAGMMVIFLLLQSVPGSEVVLFALYVCLSVFLSFSQMEFVVNPNYSASALMGNVIGLCLTMVVLASFWLPAYGSADKSRPYMIIWQSTLIAFPLMILGQGLWEILYAKLYENGANSFYIPSKAELDTETLLEQERQAQAQEPINVEL